MRNRKPTIQSYADAATYLGNKTDRPAGYKNSRVRRIDADTIGIVLHHTYVVTYYADGRIVLRTGGWHTTTTKARINEFSPARVHQANFQWFANDIEFTEGMEVSGALA